MARSPWAPDSDQQTLLAALKRAHTAIQKAEEKYKDLLADCKAAGIPIAHMADELGIERKTIYRHLGHRMK